MGPANQDPFFNLYISTCRESLATVMNDLFLNSLISYHEEPPNASGLKYSGSTPWFIDNSPVIVSIQ
jgi:hypothetical protein